MVTAVPPGGGARATEPAPNADQALQSFYQDNFRGLSKFVLSRMLRQMQAFPRLEDNRDIIVISGLLPAIERRFPGFCRFGTEQEREDFFSLPQHMLMTRDAFPTFLEESCRARLFYLEDRDVIYLALRAGSETAEIDRFGKKIFIEVISGTGSHEDFIEKANRLALDLDAS